MGCFMSSIFFSSLRAPIIEALTPSPNAAKKTIEALKARMQPSPKKPPTQVQTPVDSDKRTANGKSEAEIAPVATDPTVPRSDVFS